MANVPRHKHNYKVCASQDTCGTDRRGRVIVVTTWGCTFRGCSKSTRKRTKL